MEWRPDDEEGGIGDKQPEPEPELRLHPLLRNRWSPQVWDATHEVTPADVESILEAARWAPSAGNSQPWAFIVGRRGDSTHPRLVQHLARSSAAWAPDASMLVANLCHRNVAGTDWEYSEFGAYDLGLALGGSAAAETFGYSVEQLESSQVYLVGARAAGRLVGVGGVELQDEGIGE